ncbi:hypothetical protein [Nocardia goodfellowii]|uniref:Uncharacterized protein n=1 Tax=Nocardia goodfellowii TaxID=882446 RepID=A0ABS4QPF1_9NOCA|nr:hypothetical protein [Nocardia goodfellowii]MBP2193591.1 hypothetical protein [Nocardia goodfellowii]
MKLPEKWGRAEWARAAAPAIPSIVVDHGVMCSDATQHQALDVGDGHWVFTGLPGRQFTSDQAKAGMRLAVAPDRLEAEGWAKSLGLTINEARGLINAATPTIEESAEPTELDRDWGLAR